MTVPKSTSKRPIIIADGPKNGRFRYGNDRIQTTPPLKTPRIPTTIRSSAIRVNLLILFGEQPEQTEQDLLAYRCDTYPQSVVRF